MQLLFCLVFFFFGRLYAKYFDKKIDKCCWLVGWKIKIKIFTSHLTKVTLFGENNCMSYISHSTLLVVTKDHLKVAFHTKYESAQNIEGDFGYVDNSCKCFANASNSNGFYFVVYLACAKNGWNSLENWWIAWNGWHISYAQFHMHNEL